MSNPALVRFGDRLEETLARASQSGALTEGEYEALLVAPDFDAERFEAFRRALDEADVMWPAEDTDAAAPVVAPVAPRDRSGADRDLLDVYLDDIGRFPLLAHEDLLALARRSRAGDEEARKRIILANLRLVVHLARAYRNRGLPMLDLIEEGNLGLIHATDRFEPERGLRFSTYAAIWIRQSILRGVAEQARSVRIPVQMFQQVNRYARAERDLRGRLGHEPDPSELARELGISATRVHRLSLLLAGVRSLDENSLEAFDPIGLTFLLICGLPAPVGRPAPAPPPLIPPSPSCIEAPTRGKYQPKSRFSL